MSTRLVSMWTCQITLNPVHIKMENKQINKIKGNKIKGNKIKIKMYEDIKIKIYKN